MIGEISATTQVLGIIGHPIGHSLSPLMQNAALRALDIDAVYLAFKVDPAELTTAVAGLKAIGVRGFNVTIPYKEAILPLLDKVDGAAARIGAVNTVKIEDGKLLGFNTDAAGFLASLTSDLSFEPTGKRVVIIGAGGAARAAIVALAQAGVRSLLIVNRTARRANEICAEFKEYFPAVDMSASGLEYLSVKGALTGVDLLVNTSSVGLEGTSFDALDLDGVEHLLVYDMVYGRGPTPLVMKASAAGCRSVNGHGMLAAQGEQAFRIWLGVDPPAGLMKDMLLRR